MAQQEPEPRFVLRAECPQCGMVVCIDMKESSARNLLDHCRWCPRCYAAHDKKIALVRVG